MFGLIKSGVEMFGGCDGMELGRHGFEIRVLLEEILRPRELLAKSTLQHNL